VWAENSQRLTECSFIDLKPDEPDVLVKANRCEFVFPVLCTFDF
jgi:hypothetical protein